jgi:hypothetical protein
LRALKNLVQHMEKRLIRASGAFVCGLIACAAGYATTLEQLSLPEMAEKATAVVRARVTGAHGMLRGADVYTVYSFQIMETWKPYAKGSTGTAPVEVAVPGGIAGGLRQMVTGAPALRNGEEYVLFLWTSRSGLTQPIGLSQGVFSVSMNSQREPSQTEPVAQQSPAGERMLDARGREVRGQALVLKLADLKKEVLRANRDQAKAVAAALAQRSVK